MEAKDRLLTPEQMIPMRHKWEIRDAQDKLSFKAGIKEVVEWITPRLTKISVLVGNIRGDWTDPRGDCRAIWDILAEIEAKLKERE